MCTLTVLPHFHTLIVFSARPWSLCSCPFQCCRSQSTRPAQPSAVKTLKRLLTLCCRAHQRHGLSPQESDLQVSAVEWRCIVYQEASSSYGATKSVDQPSSPSSSTSPILPPSPPPLLPKVTIKCLLPQLDIDRVMRLTHPPSKIVSAANPRRIRPLHPRLEVACADPTRIHLPEQADELPRVALLCWRR